VTETERRRFQRIILDRPVCLVAGGHSYTGQLLDISLRGALIRSDRAHLPTPGSEGVADISLDDDPDNMIRMLVRVQHAHEDGAIGLKAIGLELDDACRLRRLVELNIADPAILQREFEQLGTD
jgi:hypothetical protein